MEKLPLIIESVLNLLFGKIDLESINLIKRSSSTYDTASQRTSSLIRMDSSLRFNDRSKITSVTHACIIIDQSNKGNKGLVVKLYTCILAVAKIVDRHRVSVIVILRAGGLWPTANV